MNKRCKLLGILLVLSAIFSLSACGKTPQSSPFYPEESSVSVEEGVSADVSTGEEETPSEDSSVSITDSSWGGSITLPSIDI